MEDVILYKKSLGNGLSKIVLSDCHNQASFFLLNLLNKSETSGNLNDGNVQKSFYKGRFNLCFE